MRHTFGTISMNKSANQRMPMVEPREGIVAQGKSAERLHTQGFL